MIRTTIDESVAVARTLPRIQALGNGELALLCTGSYGSGILVQTLHAFLSARTERIVGPIYFIEPDQRVREETVARIPQEFRSRLVVAALPNFPVGMSGASINEVLAMRESWDRHVNEGAFRWIGALKALSENGALMVIISPGGSAALAADPIERYRSEWPWKKVYAATILDEKSSTRANISDLLELYDAFIDGLIVNDNRRNSLASDAGLSLLLAGTPAARTVSERPADLANVLAKVAAGSRVATLSTWVSTLPLTWNGNVLGRSPFTNRVHVEEAIKAGVHAVVEDPLLQSLPLPPAAVKHTRMALAAMPVRPAQLRRCVEAVRHDLEPWRAHSDPDLIVEVAPVAARLLRGGASIPTLVTLLQPLAASFEDVAAYAEGRIAPDPSFVPAPPPGLIARRSRRPLSLNGAKPLIQAAGPAMGGGPS